MIKIALGIAPIYGPKNGITFVTPTITLTSNVYGIFNILSPIKHNIPIITESIIFPMMNPPKISLLLIVKCKIIFAEFGLKIA